MIPAIFTQLAVALGLLLALQRERVDSAIAGIRTFALIILFGAVAGQIGKTFGGWVVAVLAAAILVTAGNWHGPGRGRRSRGRQRSSRPWVMYGSRTWVVIGSMSVASRSGGLLLHLREPLHEFAGRMGEKDIRAIMQFVLIALVI